jgi:hypothetical protein
LSFCYWPTKLCEPIGHGTFLVFHFAVFGGLKLKTPKNSHPIRKMAVLVLFMIIKLQQSVGVTKKVAPTLLFTGRLFLPPREYILDYSWVSAAFTV